MNTDYVEIDPMSREEELPESREEMTAMPTEPLGADTVSGAYWREILTAVRDASVDPDSPAPADVGGGRMLMAPPTSMPVLTKRAYRDEKLENLSGKMVFWAMLSLGHHNPRCRDAAAVNFKNVFDDAVAEVGLEEAFNWMNFEVALLLLVCWGKGGWFPQRNQKRASRRKNKARGLPRKAAKRDTEELDWETERKKWIPWAARRYQTERALLEAEIDSRILQAS